MRRRRRPLSDAYNTPPHETVRAAAAVVTCIVIRGSQNGCRSCVVRPRRCFQCRKYVICEHDNTIRCRPGWSIRHSGGRDECLPSYPRREFTNRRAADVIVAVVPVRLGSLQTKRFHRFSRYSPLRTRFYNPFATAV